jgi:hypothetical protein
MRKLDMRTLATVSGGGHRHQPPAHQPPSHQPPPPQHPAPQPSYGGKSKGKS